MKVEWKSKGVELIGEERRAQVTREHFTANTDDMAIGGDLAIAAACYAVSATHHNTKPSESDVEVVEWTDHGPPEWRNAWPWHESWDKRSKHSRIRKLQIAGALIAAEIDRLLRTGETL